jgi:4-amino-4-deoxy-L-arabinose transferase-like glycosyltransferase
MPNELEHIAATFTGPGQREAVTRLLISLSKFPDSPRALPALVGFSALLMGTLFFVRLNSDLNYDGEIYIAAAMKFAGGMFREGLAIYPMPAYSLLIALVHNIIPDWVSAGRTISLFAMVLTVIPLYRLANDLFDARAAFWACLVFILLPETLIHSNTVLRNPPFFLFFTWAAYFAQKTLRTKRFSHLLCAAVFAWISTFFRVEGLILFPLWFCASVVATFLDSKARRAHLRLTAAWVGLFGVMVAGVHLAAGSADAAWLNRYTEWQLYFEGFTDRSLLGNYWRVADHLHQIQETSTHSGVGLHIAETVRMFLPLFYLLGAILTLSAVILPVNGIPLVWGLVRTDFTVRHILLLALMAGFLIFAIGFFIRTEVTLKRYVIMPAVLLIPWIGYGIDRILRSTQRFSHSSLAAGIVVALVLLMPAGSYSGIFKTTDDLSSEAGAWIAAQANSSYSKIVFNDQIVKFHTDMPIN